MFTHDHRVVHPHYWTDMVSPRSKLRMSIVISQEFTEDKEDKYSLQPPTFAIFRGLRWTFRALLIRQGEYKVEIEKNLGVRDIRVDLLSEGARVVEEDLLSGLWELLTVQLGGRTRVSFLLGKISHGGLFREYTFDIS